MQQKKTIYANPLIFCGLNCIVSIVRMLEDPYFNIQSETLSKCNRVNCLAIIRVKLIGLG